MLNLFLVILIIFQIVCSLIGIGGIIGVLLAAHYREKDKIKKKA